MSLFTVGLVLYVVGLLYSSFAKESIIKRQIKCRYCKKYISEKVMHSRPCLNPLGLSRTRLDDASTAAAGKTAERILSVEGWFLYECL